MTKKRSPVQKIYNDINDDFETLNDQLVRRIELFGTKPDEIDKSLELVRYHERFLETSLVGVLAATSIGYGGEYKDVNIARQFFLKHKWPDGLNLSRRVLKGYNENVKLIKREISDSINRLNAWNKTAKTIQNTNLIKADIAGHMWELIRHGRRNLTDSPATSKLYERAVRKSQREIERLAANGSPTKRLQKAYQNVIKATESGSKVALTNAINRAVKAKANYNAQRIARTETARAYGQGEFLAYQSDDLIMGYRSVLSSRHPRVDICDMFAEANFYGLGNGVYPKTDGPPYPYHPHCLCVLEPVYGETKRASFKRSAGKEYLESKPVKARQILGKGRSEAFKGSPDKWQKLTPNYNGMERHKPEIPKELFKEKG